MNAENMEIKFLDFSDKVILNCIKYLDLCELYTSVRQVCQRMKCIVDNFIQLSGVFILASERDEFDTRLPTEVLYVFTQASNTMLISKRTLPPFPNPNNSYDTEDYEVRHILDLGLFGTIVDTNRIVLGLYCKEHWRSIQDKVGIKEQRNKLKPKSHVENRERKISESKSKHCIYWSKNDAEDWNEESAATIYTTNNDINHETKDNTIESGTTEKSGQNTPRLILHNRETEKSGGNKYLLVPYLYEYSETSKTWIQIELLAIEPLIFPNDIQCQLSFREKADSIFVELRINMKDTEDAKHSFIKFTRNEDFKNTRTYANETLRPIGGSQNFYGNSNLNYQSGLCDIGDDILSFYKINQRWWHQGVLHNYGNERRCKDVSVSLRDNFKSSPTNFFQLKEFLFFIKQDNNGLYIQKYCPREETFLPRMYRLPRIVEHADKILTSANESFAILLGHTETREEFTKNDSIVLIFTEKEGVEVMNIRLSHYFCDSEILLRVK